MSEYIPPLYPQRLPERPHVGTVVLHTRGAHSRRRLALATSTLIEEDELAAGRKRRQAGPEGGMVEYQAAIDADQRHRAFDVWRGPDGEVEAAGAHGEGLTLG